MSFSSVIVTATGPAPLASPNGALLVTFDVQVDPGSADYVERAAQAALVSNRDLVIVMNTPGGLLGSMQQIVTSIVKVQDQSQGRLSVYTFVPPGALAASAGSYIALASNQVYMGSGSIIGPSTPYIIGGDPLQLQHVHNAMVAYIRSLAERNGYNVAAAVSMADNNTAYTATQAASLGLVTGMQETLDAFLATVGLGGLPVTRYDEPVYDRFLSFLSDPTVDGLFILVGVIALVLDLFHRTLFLSVVAVIFIALGFLGAQLIGGTGAALVVGFLYLTRIRHALMAQPKLIDPSRILNTTGRASTDLVPGKDGVANVGAEDFTAQSSEFIPKGSLIRVIGYADGKVQVATVPAPESEPSKSGDPSAAPPSTP